MFIRSQDHKAIYQMKHMTNIWYEEKYVQGTCFRPNGSEYMYAIFTFLSADQRYASVLGQYKTEEQAKKVIDEIMHSIMKEDEFYQMPSDEDGEKNK